jgi:hypothetical protein
MKTTIANDHQRVEWGLSLGRMPDLALIACSVKWILIAISGWSIEAWQEEMARAEIQRRRVLSFVVPEDFDGIAADDIRSMFEGGE